MTPMPLQQWANGAEPDEKMLWKSGFWAQVMFMRDRVACLFAKTAEEYRSIVQVVSTHRSKSIECPVYHLDVPKLGLKLWLRYNFYDWNVSVQADTPLDAFDFLGLVKGDGGYGYCFCQGMEKWKFPPFNEGDPTRFTACLNNDYEVFAFLLSLREQLANVHAEWGAK